MKVSFREVRHWNKFIKIIICHYEKVYRNSLQNHSYSSTFVLSTRRPSDSRDATLWRSGGYLSRSGPPVRVLPRTLRSDVEGRNEYGDPPGDSDADPNLTFHPPDRCKGVESKRIPGQEPPNNLWQLNVFDHKSRLNQEIQISNFGSPRPPYWLTVGFKGYTTLSINWTQRNGHFYTHNSWRHC